MEFIIYYRRSLMEKSELEAAQKYFKCVDLISDIPPNSFVIPRFSMYPWYQDQEKEIKSGGNKIISNYNQHRYIADLQNWVMDLGNLTPITWDDIVRIPDNGPFVLKGETNSRKSNWKKSMFAEDKKAAIEIYNILMEDSLIGQQKIFIREYVKLNSYMEGVNGMPVSKEFRFFIAYGQIVSGAFYWQNYWDDIEVKPDVSEVPEYFLQKVIAKVGNKSNFYVIDVAQKENGDWTVIELNDGIFSGLSMNDPEILYCNLRKVLDNVSV